MSLLAHFADQESLDLVAHGALTPQEAKANLISVLVPYFRHPSDLEELAVLLVPEAVNLRSIERDATAKQLYLKVESDYRKAESIDAAACYKACREWEQKVQDGLAEYWSAHNLNVDLNSLGIHDFKFEVFGIIGLLIESVMQPLLRELLFQARLAAGNKSPGDDLDRLDLGLVIDELATNHGYASFLAPAPWNLKLNQWRNMAQHFSTRVEGDKIVGTYGKGKNKHELRLSRGELFAAAKTVHLASRAVRTARNVFVIENIERVGLDTHTIEVRYEAKILHLGSSFAMQGFELVRIDIRGDVADATVRDITDMRRETRMLHSSQFVYPIWCEFPRRVLKVSCCDKEGTLLITTTARGTDCEQVADGRIPFDHLAGKVEFALTEAGRTALASGARGGQK